MSDTGAATTNMAPFRLGWMERASIRLQRARRWEFWPGWLFYIPIVLWILLLGLRYRHWTLFTAVNPGMDNGSVVGERKSRMLLVLQQQFPAALPHTQLLVREHSAAMQQLAQLAQDSGWPLVLKPDIGQRGRGVAVIHNPQQAEAYLRSANFDIVAQAFAGGEEFGVFVRRLPQTEEFEISSITHKILPTLRGDGSSTVAELIRTHSRARLGAETLFRQHRQQLGKVLERGETFALVELGAHCRGAEFRDAQDCFSPALQARIQMICAALPGFDFGRLDLRCPDATALRAGTDLRILEINGVSSEAAHVYHPGTPLWRGIAVFCEHWSRAFQLGAINRRRGIPTLGPLQLLRLFRQDLARFEACEQAAAAAQYPC